MKQKVNYLALQHDDAGRSPEETMDALCDKTGMSRELGRLLREINPRDVARLINKLPEILESTQKMKQCYPALQNWKSCEDSIGNLEAYLARCKKYEHLLYELCCPANSQYGDVTRHHYSSKNILYLDQVVQNLGGNFVNAYPVPPGSSIMMQQLPRPGFVPETVEAHFSLANGGTNFLNIEVQFFVLDETIGSLYLGSSFLDDDGRTKRVPFPSWRGRRGVRIGSAERVAAKITVNGPNNLEHATIALHLDAEGWASVCLPPDGKCTPGC